MLQVIYQEHEKMVFNLALHYVQNVEDAEEITQDVFVKVYKSMDSFSLIYKMHRKRWASNLAQSIRHSVM